MAERTVRLIDVAEAAGVSRGTASNVFNRPHLVRAELRERVMAAAETMGYRGPDPKGRLLRAGKVNAIGVVTAEPLSYFFDDPFARVLMSGISEGCDAAGAGIALVSAVNERKFAWNVRSAVVDGFILFCIEAGPRLVELTRERQLPFVALELGIDDPTISAVGVDNFAGAAVAARHLGELGHRRVAILSIPFVDDRYGPVSLAQVRAAVYSDARDRVDGYLAGLRAFGIDAAGVPIMETQNEPVSVHAALEHLFGTGTPPTAILAMSDRIALLALDWLQARGIAVPEDVSLIGFDGVPDAALARPGLTTIAQPIAEMGRRAVGMILDGGGQIRRETLPVALVPRASTAPPRRGG